MMAKVKEPNADKGGAAEEALRHYFRSLGAFVLRGVPVRQGQDEVTDVDLWTYTRASVHARHIAIVDIKNRKRAKGYERVIWFKGLQAALKANEAIIATTSGREDLKPFADRLGVRLLSAEVFRAVLSRFDNETSRLTSEELDVLWRATKLDSPMNLAQRMSRNFEDVGLGISFPALNGWIDEAAALLAYSLDHERDPGPVSRGALMCCALVALGADFLGREVAFSGHDMRREHFKNGLLFGRPDKNAIRSYVSFAEQLATDFIDRTGATAATMRQGFSRAVEELPVTQFVEFFARPAVGRELMDAALQLEAAAFSKVAVRFADLPTEAKTIVALVADYAGIERRRLVGTGSLRPAEAKTIREPSSDSDGDSTNKAMPEAKGTSNRLL